MCLKKSCLYILLAVSFFSARSLQAFYVSSDPSAVTTDARGAHEEITRQSYQLISQYLNIDTNALNLIILGNYATDVPGGFYPLSLPKLWDFPKNIVKWHNNPIGQHLHSLRNKSSDNKLESAFDACVGIKKDILFVLNKAFIKWLENTEKSESLFLIGHSAHIIQDSFSPAHSLRASSGNYNLTNLCYYGQSNDENKDQFCYHEENDLRDNIWLYNSNSEAIALAKKEWAERGELINSVNSIEDIKRAEDSVEYLHSLLTHEARLAQIATAKYLYTLTNYFGSLPTGATTQQSFAELETKVNSIFDDSGEIFKDIMPTGILNCSELKK